MIGFLKTSPKVSFTADKKTFTDLGGGTAVVVKVRVCELRLHRLTASFSEGVGPAFSIHQTLLGHSMWVASKNLASLNKGGE